MSYRNLVLCRNLLLVSALFVQVETLYRAENSVFFRNLLLVSALFAQAETLYRAENSVLCRNLLIVSALFAQAETICRAETRCFSETFCLFLPYLFKPRPSLFVELGAFVHQRETSARFCHQRNLQAFFVTFCLFAFGRN